MARRRYFYAGSRWPARYGRWLKSLHDCRMCGKYRECDVDNGGEAGCGLFVPSFQKRDWRKPKKSRSLRDDINI
jgi:hypothetical protein